MFTHPLFGVINLNHTELFILGTKTTIKKNFYHLLDLMQLSFAEARGKLKKLMLPILLALKFKTAVILPIVLTVLALVSLKALKVR